MSENYKLSTAQWEMIQSLKEFGSLWTGCINKRTADSLVRLGIGEYIKNNAEFRLTKKFKETNETTATKRLYVGGGGCA